MPRWLQPIHDSIFGPDADGAAVFFVLGGALGFVCCLVNLLRGRATLAWPTAPGTITESREDRTAPSIKADEGYVTSSYATIRYRFEVSGQTYSGWRVALLDSNSGEEGRVLLRRYPEGRRVTVHYDPRNPENALLERGGDPHGILWALGSLATVVVAWLCR